MTELHSSPEMREGIAPRAWLVRAGSHGEYGDYALNHGVVVVGWEDLGDLSGISTREALQEKLEETYTDAGYRRLVNWAGQLWTFLHRIQPGDFVVLPLKSRPVLAVGRVTGGYAYVPHAPAGARHRHPVEWLRTDVRRTAVKQDLLDSLGAFMTVCEIRRNDAANRIAHIAEHATDPGHAPRAEHRNSEELLADAARHTDGDYIEIPTRELLAYWGAKRRHDWVVDQIQRDLLAAGLTTEPSFAEGGVEDVVLLVPLSAEEKERRTAEPPPGAVEGHGVVELPQLTLQIGDLRSASDGVVSVTPQDDLGRAQSLMMANDYSQLAVLAGKRTLRGAVTWASIARARILNPKATLADAIVRAQVVRSDDDLLELVPRIAELDFAFVQAEDKQITGIVTTADLSLQFSQLTSPFFLVGEIERRLRHLIDEVFSTDDLHDALGPRDDGKGKEVESARHLTIGEYIRLLQNPARWSQLSWGLDRQVFIEALDRVRLARNEIMHFSPDPLEPGEIDHLQKFLKWLRWLDPRP